MNSVGQPSDYLRPAAGPHPEGFRRTKIKDWRYFRQCEALHLGVRFCQIGKSMLRQLETAGDRHMRGAGRERNGVPLRSVAGLHAH